MQTTIDLDPDAPHSPERTRALADVGASVIRTLNYATRTTDGLNDPGDAYELLGALGQLAERLPQLCGQIRDYLTEAHNRGELFEPADGPHQGSATLALMLTRDALGLAASEASTLRQALRAAQSEIRAIRYAGPDVDAETGAESTTGAVVHAYEPLEFSGPACGADAGRSSMILADVTCPQCRTALDIDDDAEA